jgi:hypothetical protein
MSNLKKCLAYFGVGLLIGVSVLFTALVGIFYIPADIFFSWCARQLKPV